MKKKIAISLGIVVILLAVIALAFINKDYGEKKKDSGIEIDITGNDDLNDDFEQMGDKDVDTNTESNTQSKDEDKKQLNHDEDYNVGENDTAVEFPDSDTSKKPENTDETEKPSQSEKPIVPEKPVVPEEPVNPEEPSEPEKPTDSGKKEDIDGGNWTDPV